jgi:hypothetical protein
MSLSVWDGIVIGAVGGTFAVIACLVCAISKGIRFRRKAQEPHL